MDDNDSEQGKGDTLQYGMITDNRMRHEKAFCICTVKPRKHGRLKSGEKRVQTLSFQFELWSSG